MFSDPKEVRDHLRNDILYKTYSDERVAALYLDNFDDLPFHILVKMFDVLLDPLFSPKDITFESAQDIFSYISTYRRESIPSPHLGRPASPPDQLVPRSSSIPTDIVSLVIDKMVENRTPLSAASMEKVWRRAYVDDVSDFHAMSLVHPSWTPIARGGLRRRAIIPYDQLDSFLLSPLCGPWVTEVIIYWTVNKGTVGIMDNDVALFASLLKRVPNIRSLAVNTSLVWLTYEFSWNTGDMPSLRMDSCLELISDLLPSLENLQLNHFEACTDSLYHNYITEDGSDITEDEPLSESLKTCCELGNLIALLPRMQSLKSLTLFGWAEDEGESREADWSEHPSPNFVTLDFLDKPQLSDRGLKWLVKPRGGFSLRSLSISIRQLQRIDGPLPSLQELRLCMSSESRPYIPRSNIIRLSNILEGYDQLVYLDLFGISIFDLRGTVLPKKLEHIMCHSSGMHLLLPRSGSDPSFLLEFIRIMKVHLSYLARLQSLSLIGVRSISDAWMAGWKHAIEGVPVMDVPAQFLDLCEKHNIRLTCRDEPRTSRRYYM